MHGVPSFACWTNSHVVSAVWILKILDLVNSLAEVVAFGLLCAGGDGDAVVPILCGVVDQPLHCQLVPVLFEWRFWDFVQGNISVVRELLNELSGRAVLILGV